MGEIAMKQQLHLELEKLSPEVLRQLFEFLQFLKQAEKNVSKNKTKGNPIKKFIGCMAGEDGDELAEVVKTEFSKIEGEW